MTRITGRLPALLQTASGVSAIFLGLIVIIGWHIGSATLTQVRPGLPAMQYVNALAFVIAGVGVLSAVVRRDGIAGIAGLLTAVIGVLSLTQDLLHVDPTVDFLFGVKEYLASGAARPARMPPNAAICFGLIGIALFVRRAAGPARMSMVTSLLGSTTAALGLVAVVGYVSDLPPAYGWGRLTRMALHTAAGLLVLGSGLVANGWRDSPAEGVVSHRIPTLVGVASLTVTVAVWHALVAHDRQRTLLLISTQAAYLGAAVSAPLDAQVRALERMAHRWERRSSPREDWAAEARALLQDFDAYHVIERVDAFRGESWAVPEGGAVAPYMRDSLFATARGAEPIFASSAVDLGDGVMGLLLVVPVIESERLTSGIVGAIRVDALMSRTIAPPEESGYETALFDGVRQVHGKRGTTQVADEWMAEAPVDVRGAPLRLRVWPTPSRLAQLEGRMSSLILAGGLLLSVVLACMTFFAGTSRRRERELREAARQLNEHMKARETANAEIARARDAALESDRLKSEFVANVSHELRTPMNGILGLTELLLDTDLTPEQREHASTVRDCGETLLALLNDILDLSKVAAGKLEIQIASFEPRRMVQQVADLFLQRARAKDVDLVCLVHHDVPDWIDSDPGRVRQILTNLLGNAVKFTEQGEITIRVTAEAEAGQRVMLRVEVGDTGIGISPEAQAQIFQPFVQADGSITRRYGGTGLGLVISRQLAGLLGGEMGMSSEPGRGSTFWFTIRASVARPARARREHVESALRGVRVLVLDDAETSRERLVAMLESWHMEVTSEGTPERALRTLQAAAERSQPFDAALVDLRNVGTSVLDFADAAHAAGLVPPVRLVLMSTRGQRGDAQRAQQSGAAAYLTKPIGPSSLFDCLVTVLDAPTHAAGRSPAPAPLVTRYTLESQQQSKPALLVVEDNIVNQKVMVGLLAKLGYRAEVAPNGIAALEALQRASYPIVFMDSQMPVMDGFAATAEIRRREGTAMRTIVVAVTAHAMKGERERCLAAGMDDYLSKPVSLDRLRDIIERWMPAHPAAPVQADSVPPVDGNTAQTLASDVLAELRELDAGMPGLLADVISTFVSETPDRITRLAAALDQGDLQEAERAAHGLKGSAAAVGAQRLSAAAASIEQDSRARNIDGCRSNLPIVRQEFTQARDELVRMAGTSGSAVGTRQSSDGR